MTVSGPAAGAGAARASEAIPTRNPTIARQSFAGWDDTYLITNGAIAARVVADVGPRVVELGPATGPNLLYVRTREMGGRGEERWKFRGGWRLWIAPERRATTYALDNTPCVVARIDDAALRVSGPPQPEAGVRKHVTVRVDPARPRITVTSEVENVADTALTCAPWTLAVLRAGGRAFVPMECGPVEALDSVRRLICWSYTRMADPRYRFGDRLVEVDHAAVLRGPGPTWLSADRATDESKIGVDARAGWAAYLLDRTLLVTHAAVDDGPRVDGGATLEIYSNREFLELEHVGVLRVLAPRESLAFVETWSIFEGVELPPVEAGLDAVEAALAPLVRAATA